MTPNDGRSAKAGQDCNAAATKVYRLRPVGKGGYQKRKDGTEMIEIELSLNTMLSMLAALALWEVIKQSVLWAVLYQRRKQKEPADPHEEDKQRKQEQMLEGFNNLMSYDMDAARAAARGDLQ